MNDYTVRVLTDLDRVAVSELRSQAYENTFSNITNKFFLNWGPTDKKNTVYGLFRGANLISSIRFEHIDTFEALSSSLEISHEKLGARLPLAVTSRACTKPNFRNQGAHSLLKLICLKRAYDEGYEYCMASMKKNSSRINGLTKLGYEIIESDQNWKGFLQDSSPPVVTRLNLKLHGQNAIEALTQNCSHLIKDIPGFYENKL